jgi:hypothetical protein
LEDALAESRALVDMEPFAWIFISRLRATGVRMRDPAVVEEAARHEAARYSGTTGWHLFAQFWLAVARGDMERANAEVQAAYRSDPALAATVMALWRWSQGDPAIADDVARSTIRHDFDSSVFAVMRGDLDLFFESVAQPRSRHRRYYFFDRLLIANRPEAWSDPRTKRYLREWGFEAYWRAKGWPPECRPKGHLDFECTGRGLHRM